MFEIVDIIGKEKGFVFQKYIQKSDLSFVI